MLDRAIELGAGACALVAGWLAFVIVAVLPARDPDRIAAWSLVAAFLLALAALSVALVRMPRAAVLTVLTGVAALASVVLGAAFIVAMLKATASFEGYIVLIGLVCVAHGMVVLTRIAVVRRAPARC